MKKQSFGRIAIFLKIPAIDFPVNRGGNFRENSYAPKTSKNRQISTAFLEGKSEKNTIRPNPVN